MKTGIREAGMLCRYLGELKITRDRAVITERKKWLVLRARLEETQRRIDAAENAHNKGREELLAAASPEAKATLELAEEEATA